MPAAAAEGVPATASAPPLLAVHALTKRFGGVQALRGIDLELVAGEVHGLVGANGAGKSTLIRLLAGLHRPDAGQIRLDGRAVAIDSPSRATALGLAFIHQELALVTQLTVLENLMLGVPKPTRLGLIDWRAVRALVRPVALRVGFDFGLDVPVAGLSTAQRWLVSIGRALIRDARVIVMDEPTASLSARESAALFRIVRTLAAERVAVLYVSHKLDEVLDLCGRVTVLRDGRSIGRFEGAAISRATLIEAIVGARPGNAGPLPAAAPSRTGGVVLEVRDLVRRPLVAGLSFRLHRGEVLGLTGLVGAGRTEAMRLVFGADRPDGGSMTLLGCPYLPASPHAAVAAGVGLVPEERRAEGLILGENVAFNLSLANLARFRRRRSPFIDRAGLAAFGGDIVRRLAVKTPSLETAVAKLSGGNQQKVVIGKWLARPLRVLILDEPSRGVDIGARGAIHALIRRLAAEGLAVIVVSSDAEELPGLCDRVIVVAAGRAVAEFTGDGITQDAMVRASYQQAKTPALADG